MNYSDEYGNHIVNVEGEDYLIQGKVDDPMIMFREVDDILECERDNVQEKMVGDSYEL